MGARSSHHSCLRRNFFRVTLTHCSFAHGTRKPEHLAICHMLRTQSSLSRFVQEPKRIPFVLPVDRLWVKPLQSLAEMKTTRQALAARPPHEQKILAVRAFYTLETRINWPGGAITANNRALAAHLAQEMTVQK